MTAEISGSWLSGQTRSREGINTAPIWSSSMAKSARRLRSVPVSPFPMISPSGSESPVCICFSRTSGENSSSSYHFAGGEASILPGAVERVCVSCIFMVIMYGQQNLDRGQINGGCYAAGGRQK